MYKSIAVILILVMFLTTGCTLFKESKSAQNMSATGITMSNKQEDYKFADGTRIRYYDCSVKYNGPKNLTGGFNGSMHMYSKCKDLIVSGAGQNADATSEDSRAVVESQVGAAKDVAGGVIDAASNIARPGFAP